MNETDFDERRNINKRKRLIKEGRDPDEEDELKNLKKKQKAKSAKKERKKKELLKNEDS